LGLESNDGSLVFKGFVLDFLWEVIATVNIDGITKNLAIKKLVELVDRKSSVDYKERTCAEIESEQKYSIGILKAYKELIVYYEKAFLKGSNL
jgi:hypothetical protein